MKARKCQSPRRLLVERVKLQWSRADEGAEIWIMHPSRLRYSRSFNGAAPMKARKSDYVAVDESHYVSFNGAAPMKARK